MAQLDSSIPMSYQFGQSPIQQAAGAMNLASMIDQRRQNQITFDQQQEAHNREQQELAAMKQLYPRFIDANGDGDRDGFVLEVWKINPQKALDLQKEFLEFDKLRATANGSNKQTDLQRKLEHLRKNYKPGDMSEATEMERYNLAQIPNAVFNLDPETTGKKIEQQNQIETGTRQGKVETAAAASAASTESKLRAEKGKKILSESAASGLGSVFASSDQLNELLKGLDNPDAPQGPIAQIRALNPYDWQAQTKNQLVAATKQLVGKALEGGVLRKEDEDKYNKILPTIADTYQSAVVKSKQLMNMLDISYKTNLESLKKAGYDVSDFEASLVAAQKPPKGSKQEAESELIKEAQAGNVKARKYLDSQGIKWAK